MSEAQPQPPSPPSKKRRRTRSLEEVRSLVDEWKQSGLTATAWCIQRGFLRSALSSWRYRLDAQPSGQSVPFLEVRRVTPQPIITGLRLEIGDQCCVTGLELDQVIRLIQALRGGQS